MLVEGFGGCFPAEGLSRSGVERHGDGLQVGRAVLAEVGALWEVLTQQAASTLTVFSLVPRCQGLCGSQK